MVRCAHIFLKKLPAFKYAITIHCPDCGDPFAFASDELRKQINKLFIEPKIPDDHDPKLVKGDLATILGVPVIISDVDE